MNIIKHPILHSDTN